jgi:hypothetical protein
MRDDMVIIVSFMGKRLPMRMGQTAIVRGENSQAIVKRADSGLISISVVTSGTSQGTWNRDSQDWDWD